MGHRADVDRQQSVHLSNQKLQPSPKICEGRASNWEVSVSDKVTILLGFVLCLTSACVSDAPGLLEQTDALPRDFTLIEPDVSLLLDSGPNFDMQLTDMTTPNTLIDGLIIDADEASADADIIDAEQAFDDGVFDSAFSEDTSVLDADLTVLDADVDQALADMTPMEPDQRLDLAVADVMAADMEILAPTRVRNEFPPRGTRVGGSQNGGRRFDDVCPEGQILIGVAGEIRGNAQYLGRLRGICGEVRIDLNNPMSITTVAGADLPLRGLIGGGGNFGITCQAGSAVIGYSGRAGNLIDQLVLHCGTLTLADRNVVPVGNNPLPPVGGNGGNAVPLVSCPDGQVAAGALIRAGDGIDGFGLLCSSLLGFVP